MKVWPRLAPLDMSTDQVCPECFSRYIMYNGNYMCEGWEYRQDSSDPGCRWAMPDTRDMSELFIACYSSLMRNRGQEPEQRVIDEARRDTRGDV